MLRPKRALFWLKIALLAGVVFVSPKLSHASIFTDNLNLLINEVKKSFTDLARPVSAPVIANTPSVIANTPSVIASEAKQSKKINIIVAKPLETPLPANPVVVNPIRPISPIGPIGLIPEPGLPVILNDSYSHPEQSEGSLMDSSSLSQNDTSTARSSWTLLEQVQKNFQHISQSISEQADYNTELSANLLDQIKSLLVSAKNYLADIFTPAKETPPIVATKNRIIIATPVIPSGIVGVNLGSSQDLGVLRRPDIGAVVQPSAPAPQSTVSPTPAIASPPSLLASLQQQLDDLKKNTNASFLSFQQNQAYLSQITSLGPRGSTVLTISNPTISGKVEGLEDEDIPDSITAQNYLPLTGGTVSGNLTVNGTLAGAGGSAISFADKIKVGTDTLIIDGINNYLSTTGATLSFYSTSTPIQISFLNATSTYSSYFTGNLGIGTTSPGGALAVGSGTTTILSGETYILGTTTVYALNATATLAVASSSPGSGNNLSVVGHSVFGGNVSITNNLDVQGTAKIDTIAIGTLNPPLGIGSSSPSLALEVGGFGVVKGNWNIEATSTASSFIATSTLSVGTTSPATASAALSVQGNSYITGGLGVGVATTSAGGLFVKGSADIYDGITLRGGNLVLPDGVSGDPSIQFGADSDTGFYRVGDGWMGMALNGALSFSFQQTSIGWGNDAFIVRDGADILSMRNGTNAQTLRVYNTFTDASNYERLAVEAVSNVFQIESEAAGTGVVRDIAILGDVGIGTTSPGLKLEVAGFGVVKGNWNIEATSTASSFIATSTLSVGTTSPATASAALSVQGNSYITGGLGVGVATTSPGGLFVKGSADIYDGLVVRSGGTEASSPNLFVKGGRVGIGTAAPTVALDIVGGISASTNLTAPWWNTTGSGAGKTVFTMTSNGASYGDIQVETVAGGGVWSLGYQAAPSATIGTAVLTWNGTGQVGLSTTTPYGQLAIDSLAGTVDAKTPTFVVQDSGTSTPSIYVDGGYGRIGFGSSSPKAQVAIEVTEEPGNDANEGIPAFVISSRGTSTPFFTVVRNTSLAAGGGMFVGIGTSSPNGAFSVDTTDVNAAVPAILVRAGATANVAIQVDSGDNCKDGSADPGACALNDLAELFRSSEPMEAGDLAMIDPENPVKLKKATQDKKNLLAGAISTSPAIVFEGSGLKALGGIYKSEENKVPLTLSGRIPVKVNLEGGAILIGDPITISSVAGVGKKATESGKIVGYALESSQDPEVLRRQSTSGEPVESIDGVAKIVVLTNLENWTDPSVVPTDPAVILSGSEESLVARIWNALITKLTEWFQTALVFVKELTSDKITTQQLCVGSTCLNEAQLQALLNGNFVSSQDPSVSSADPGSSDDQNIDVVPPVITLNGANPAEIEMNAVYSDLGVTVTDNVTQNLGYKIILKQRDPSASPQDDTAPYVILSGSEESPAIYPNELILDTSAPAEYTITYTATDQAGNTGTATRTVRVVDPYASPVIAIPGGAEGEVILPPVEPAPAPMPIPIPEPTPEPEPAPTPTE